MRNAGNPDVAPRGEAPPTDEHRPDQNNPDQSGAIPADRYWTFGLIAGIGCLVDLVSKAWVFQRLGPPGSDTYWILEGYFGFQTSLNQGALFGIGQGKVWLFASLSFIAALSIVWWLFVAGAARDRLLTISLACVMAGILGNLYDRLGIWSGGQIHAVRDWVLLQYNGWVWPNFNIADSLLVCGAALLVWHAFQEERAKRKTPAG